MTKKEHWDDKRRATWMTEEGTGMQGSWMTPFVVLIILTGTDISTIMRN